MHACVTELSFLLYIWLCHISTLVWTSSVDDLKNVLSLYLSWIFVWDCRGDLKCLWNIQFHMYRTLQYSIFRSVQHVSHEENESFNRHNEYLPVLKHLFNELYVCNGIPSNFIMKDVLGFSIERNKSSIPAAGLGVFVTDGMVKASSIVALYPGAF